MKEEKRDLLQENITGISIPKTGRALLEANPAGLFKTAGVLFIGDPEGSHNEREKSHSISIGPEAVCQAGCLNVFAGIVNGLAR
jgi:hypothetical protein